MLNSNYSINRISDAITFNICQKRYTSSHTCGI